jgi:hypothetical protein
LAPSDVEFAATFEKAQAVIARVTCVVVLNRIGGREGVHRRRESESSKQHVPP